MARPEQSERDNRWYRLGYEDGLREAVDLLDDYANMVDGDPPVRDILYEAADALDDIISGVR